MVTFFGEIGLNTMIPENLFAGIFTVSNPNAEIIIVSPGDARLKFPSMFVSEVPSDPVTLAYITADPC